MAKHTPTPWIAINHDDKPGKWIFAPANRAKQAESHAIAIVDNLQSNDAENVAFIIQAANSHDRLTARSAYLLEELKKIRAACEANERSLINPGWADAHRKIGAYCSSVIATVEGK